MFQFQVFLCLYGGNKGMTKEDTKVDIKIALIYKLITDDVWSYNRIHVSVYNRLS